MGRKSYFSRYNKNINIEFNFYKWFRTCRGQLNDRNVEKQSSPICYNNINFLFGEFPTLLLVYQNTYLTTNRTFPLLGFLLWVTRVGCQGGNEDFLLKAMSLLCKGSYLLSCSNFIFCTHHQSWEMQFFLHGTKPSEQIYPKKSM